MKREYTVIIIAALSFLLCRNTDEAKAQWENPCGEDPRIVTFEKAESHGFDIETAQKTAPSNPIVIGQDKDKIGADVNVIIKSYKGTVAYSRLEGYQRDCIYYPTKQEGLESCGQAANFYWTPDYNKPICNSYSVAAYRFINVGSVRVWLDPTDDTERWLGWRKISEEQRNPLRYMYPEKWSLGYWGASDFTTISDPGLWNDPEVEKFTEDNPGFNFIKSDPREIELPSEALYRVSDPLQSKDGILFKRRVLGILGTFDLWPGYGQAITGQGQCLVRAAKGRCGWYPDVLAKYVAELNLDFFNIPLDLPGEWRIGVEVKVNPAEYTYEYWSEGLQRYVQETHKEKFDTGDLSRWPGHGYDMTLDEHKFLSYIYLSTPCDEKDPKSCWE
jgi:hypothetical protein